MVGNELANALSILCRLSVPVTVLLPSSGGICRGRFGDFTEDLISVELIHRPKKAVFVPLSECVFVFRWGERDWVFLAQVREFRRDESMETLVVRTPDEAASECRSSFRVEIFKDRSPVVRVRANGQEFATPRPVDLSLTGILLEFPKEAVPDLSIGSRVEVVMEFEKEVARLVGEIRRRDQARYGIFFPDTIKSGHLHPPEDLTSIYGHLERIWLRRRAV